MSFRNWGYREKLMIVLATPHSRYDFLQEVLKNNGIECTRIHSPEELTIKLLGELRPRYIFFPHWSWRIPHEVHHNYECVIFHMTDLPFGRGGSPLQNLIVAGLQETYVSALRCVDEMDAGPIYMKLPLSLHGSAEEILLRAADVVSSMMRIIVKTNPAPIPQQGPATVFRRRRPEDGNLANLKELGQIHDFIRMLDAEGYPQAFIETEYFRFEFSRASLRPSEVRADVRIIRKTE